MASFSSSSTTSSPSSPTSGDFELGDGAVKRLRTIEYHSFWQLIQRVSKREEYRRADEIGKRQLLERHVERLKKKRSQNQLSVGWIDTNDMLDRFFQKQRNLLAQHFGALAAPAPVPPIGHHMTAVPPATTSVEAFRALFGAAAIQGPEWTAASTEEAGMAQPGLNMESPLLPSFDYGNISSLVPADGPLGGFRLGDENQPHLFGGGDPDGPVDAPAESSLSTQISIEDMQAPQAEEQGRQSTTDGSQRLQRLEDENRRLGGVVRQLQQRLERLENRAPPSERSSPADAILVE